MADLQFAAARAADIDALAEVLSHAFGFPPAEAGPWISQAGLENARVLRRGDRVAGGLLEIPMAQFFGGVSIPTMGVAGVAVAPEERGSGAAKRLMIELLRETRAQGIPLSTLYPATVTLYRRAGYERAGARYATELDPRTCTLGRAKDLEVAEVKACPEEVRALYRKAAQSSPGFLDRGPYVWQRVWRPRGLTTKTFTFSGSLGLEGYVVLSHKTPDGSASVVEVSDLAATTARGAEAVLRFLVEYRSLASVVRWYGGPSDVFAAVLPERHASVRIVDYFMLRVVDPARALALRGYPRGMAQEITIELEDASLPENSGVYALAADQGAGRVAAGESAPGAPRVTLSERALAALYAGHLSPEVLASAGWLETDDEGKARLAALFGGPPPTMRDAF
jgi:predicted acetyltransferase